MAGMDVFSGDGFSLRELTAAVNVPEYSPTRIAELGIFQESGVTTPRVSVERLTNDVALVQSTSRGGAPAEVASDLRTLYDLNTVRIALSDTIHADEILGIRSFGSDSEQKTLQDEVNRRNQALAANIAATIEYQRFTAIMGATLDANGATLYDSSTVFGISDNSEATVDTNGSAGVLRSNVSAAIRTMEAGLKGRPYTRAMAFVDAAFFDNLVAHEDIRNSFQYVDGAQLRERTAGRSIDFGGVTFEEYRPLAGSNPLGTGKGILFPLGSSVFQSRFAPADHAAAIGSVGLPMYARTFPDHDGDRWVRLEVQSNTLNINTDPACVVALDDGQ